MNLYSETELDNDIKYVKEMFSVYQGKYRELETNVLKMNKTIQNRMCFISLQFKNLFDSNIGRI